MEAVTHYPTLGSPKVPYQGTFLLPGYEKEIGIVRMVCITHKNCLDGIFSAAQIELIKNEIIAAASRSVSNDQSKRKYEMVYIEKEYETAFSETEETAIAAGDIIFIVDVSMNTEQLMNLLPIISGAKLVWIDHHETSYETAKYLINARENEDLLLDISSEHCAAMNIHMNYTKLLNHICSWLGIGITNGHMFAVTILSTKSLRILLYVNDRDMWAKELDDTAAVTAYLYAWLFGDDEDYTSRIEKVTQLLRKNNNKILKVVANMITTGELMIAGTNRIIANIMKTVKGTKYIEAFGCNAVIVNSPAYQSELGESLYTKWPNAAAVIYYVDISKNTVNISFRSGKNGPDVEQIARKYNGGGHVHASGCSISIEEFFKLVGEQQEAGTHSCICKKAGDDSSSTERQDVTIMPDLVDILKTASSKTAEKDERVFQCEKISGITTVSSCAELKRDR